MGAYPSQLFRKGWDALRAAAWWIFVGFDALVGAVGIENSDVRNFKDLRGMRRNTKSLKRNDEAREGILIAPSKLPRVFFIVRVPSAFFNEAS